MYDENQEEDYEGELDLEEAGHLEEAEDEDTGFEADYDRIFGEDDVDADVQDFDRDAITGRKSKRPKLSVLNKSKLSKQELDELFLER